MTNPVFWFEIPVTDIERAKKFYSTLLGVEMVDYPMPDPNMKYAVFPHNKETPGASGALMEAPGFQKPSMDGTTVYLDGGDDLSVPLARVEAAGGKILMPKTSIGENGFMALFADTEGNKVALHSMK